MNKKYIIKISFMQAVFFAGLAMFLIMFIVDPMHPWFPTAWKSCAIAIIPLFFLRIVMNIRKFKRLERKGISETIV